MKFDADDIRILRRYTGDYFTLANGYNFRKKLTPARTRTVIRYLDKIREMTLGNYALVKPERGQKRELFAYTGQTGYGKFKVAIIKTPKKTTTKVIYDKTKQKGDRISIDYPKLKQREVKITKEHILYFLSIDDKEQFIEFIEQQAPAANLFLINTEGGSMWARTAGNAETVADIVFELAEKYGTQFFTRNAYSHFDNWIESISCYTNDQEMFSYIAERHAHRQTVKEHFTRLGMPFNLRYSDVTDTFFETEDGRLLRVYARSALEKAIKNEWAGNGKGASRRVGKWNKTRKKTKSKRDKAKGRG
ncbi:MAG: hypothetical protein V4563_17305 [Pseudomonadota bacterium]